MTRTPAPAVLALALAVPACAPETPSAESDEWDDKLATRVVDYSAALRIAALRLTGDLPTLDQIRTVADAPDDIRPMIYGQLVQDFIAGPRFAAQMVMFWKDTFRLGGAPDLETAPVFLARLTVENGSYLDAFTAERNTCPSFDPVTSTFTDGDCFSNVPDRAGVLTDPGMLRMNFSNFAFRRVRWVQETFACTRFPAEIAAAATDVGGDAPYTGTFPFESIAGGRVDFTDTKSVICANCHSNMNHIAPLFAHYDFAGEYHGELAVPTTLPGNPTAEPTDYLPVGEPLAWRYGVAIGNMGDLGRAMAADPDIARCAISRLWNWALGKPDIVDTATWVPDATIRDVLDRFTANEHRLRDAIYQIYTSDDFVRF
jgi:hypothetical protein